MHLPQLLHGLHIFAGPSGRFQPIQPSNQVSSVDKEQHGRFIYSTAVARMDVLSWTVDVLIALSLENSTEMSTPICTFIGSLQGQEVALPLRKHCNNVSIALSVVQSCASRLMQ